jgi:hypothetical protein
MYLITWIQYYLFNRKFCIRVENETSELKTIGCGVPQGAVLSPTLFSIYINDLPSLYNKNKSYSLLFADDVSTFFIFKKLGKTEKAIKDYMLSMQAWLSKWRLTMHPKKCNQMLFNINSNKQLNKKHSFKLHNETIPSCESLKFLGITFDLGLNFLEHVKDIKKKCINRLNIIKILSNKKWKLNHKTLTSIYLALIRSIMDYSSFIMPFLSKSLTKTLQSTQNTALKCIYKLKYDTRTSELVEITKIPLIKERANTLNENFIKKAQQFKNELVLDLIKEYKEGSKNFKKKTIFCLLKHLF